MTFTLKHLSRLLCPRQRGTVAQIENRHGKHLASIDQPLQDLGRKVGQAQLPTDVPLRESHGDGKVTNLADLAGFHAPPPAPGPTDRAQDMGILCLVLAGQVLAQAATGSFRTGFGCSRHP